MILTMAAEHNEIEAQYDLGLTYSEKDINKAINYYTMAANQNYLPAQINVGIIYYNLKKIDKAIYYYNFNKKIQKIYEQCTRESIEQRPLISDLMFEFGPNFMPNIKITKKRKDPEVQFILNIADFVINISNYCPSSNERGKSSILETMKKNLYIRQDINKAFYYYKLAANQNIP